MIRIGTPWAHTARTVAAAVAPRHQHHRREADSTHRRSVPMRVPLARRVVAAAVPTRLNPPRRSAKPPARALIIIPFSIRACRVRRRCADRRQDDTDLASTLRLRETFRRRSRDLGLEFCHPLGQAEHALADDVALDLAGAAGIVYCRAPTTRLYQRGASGTASVGVDQRRVGPSSSPARIRDAHASSEPKSFRIEPSGPGGSPRSWRVRPRSRVLATPWRRCELRQALADRLSSQAGSCRSGIASPARASARSGRVVAPAGAAALVHQRGRSRPSSPR